MAKKNLFAVAKEKGATASPKPQKEEVVLKDAKFHADLSRLADLNSKMDEMKAEAAVLSAEVKERSIREFSKLYEDRNKYPGSFIVRGTGLKGIPSASLMFIPTDRYLKIGEERSEELQELFGEQIVEEKTTFTMNPELIEKYGEVLSDLIYGSKLISKDDKEKLIQATTSYEVKKGTISELHNYPVTIAEMVEEVKPVFQLKNIKIDEE